MEFVNSETKPNPWCRANFVSRMFYWWLIPLLRKSKQGNLKLGDIYDCPETNTAKEVEGILQKEWDKELMKLKSGRQPSLGRAIVRAFGLRYCLNEVLFFMEECFFSILQPLLLGYLLQHFAKTKILPKPYLYLISAAFCLLSASYTFTTQRSFYIAQYVAMRIKVACCSLIYKKALSLSQVSLGKTTVGQMVNLLSSDVNVFDLSLLACPYALICPIQMVIIVCVLWTHVEYSGIAGVSALILFSCLQSFVGKYFSNVRKKIAVLTDQRLRLMSEIIAGMRVIKMYGWELSFAKLADLSRRKEMKKIRQTCIVDGANKALFFIATKLIPLVTFVVFLLGVTGDLTPEKMFVCLSLFNIIDRNFTSALPVAISAGANCVISLKRIQKFLLLEEQADTNNLGAPSSTLNPTHCGIQMSKVQASWNQDGGYTLDNITLNVKPGELLAVVGPVGCGKSSLLMSILGEIPVTSGKVQINGRVGYASQEAWIIDGSIRQNIVFGRDFDEVKYKEVLNVCALNKDIEQFPYGDRTLVGERGVILSGGQRARVSLARVMYFDADIFLLDDPLSAVDAGVSKHLFEKCICGYLKDKVRILATHQIQFLKDASQILVLKDGKCLVLGSYEDVVRAGIDLSSLMNDKGQEHHQDNVAEINNISSIQSTMPISAQKTTLSINSTVDDENRENCTNLKTSENAPTVREEIKSSGSINLKVYRAYLKSAGGPVMRIAVLIFCITTQVIYNGCDFWLTHWTKLEQIKYYVRDCWNGFNKTFLNETGFYSNISDHTYFKKTVVNVSDDCFTITQNYTKDMFDANEDVNMNFRLSGYTGLVLVGFLFSFLRSTIFFEMCMRASVTLHDKMFGSVFRSPIEFFDRNPVGRVLNRFSKDAGVIDEMLPYAVYDVIQQASVVCGTICVNAIVEPYLLLPAAAIGILFVFVGKLFLPAMRDLKRYEGITRSPVLSHLRNSLYGLATIRAFRVQESFKISFGQHQDHHTATWFIFISVARLFSHVLHWLFVLYIVCVTITIVILSEDPYFASSAGLVIVSAMQLSGRFQWCVRRFTEVESQMTSVERVMEYSNLKSEAALESNQDSKPPQNWPLNGHIVYRNVSLTYETNEPPVLKNLSFEIYPEEKVGIIGRTGAGKSSIIATLLRLKEPEGEIEIDNVSTMTVGLHDLRKKISVIPQDPVLFSGPIRRNLDPFSEHSDDELWQALEEVCLKDYIKETSNGLDTEVSEGGNNFSVGQRQLICLARTILRRNKILILDEATANVDTNTDSLIQNTIRKRFLHCTVLTIAHRLHTIMDSNRVLVLDAGEMKEFDEPYNLLQNPNSLFSLMVQQTGPMAGQLKEIAHASHMKKFRQKVVS